MDHSPGLLPVKWFAFACCSSSMRAATDSELPGTRELFSKREPWMVPVADLFRSAW